jgi:hypothetical protein
MSTTKERSSSTEVPTCHDSAVSQLSSAFAVIAGSNVDTAPTSSTAVPSCDVGPSLPSTADAVVVGSTVASAHFSHALGGLAPDHILDYPALADWEAVCCM